jgi:hypothetical protein
MSMPMVRTCPTVAQTHGGQAAGTAQEEAQDPTLQPLWERLRRPWVNAQGYCPPLFPPSLRFLPTSVGTMLRLPPAQWRLHKSMAEWVIIPLSQLPQVGHFWISIIRGV